MKLAQSFQIVALSVVGLATWTSKGQIFVSSYDRGTVGEYTTTGATVNASLISGVNGPTAVALDGNGELFVTINNDSKIAKYTISGAVVNASLISGFRANGIVSDGNGTLYVVDYDNQKIKKYTTSGTLLKSSLVSGLTQPQGIALDGNGNLYVANWTSGSGWGTIGKYTTNGVTVNATLITGTSFTPTGLALDGQGYIYVANANGPVGKYTTDGATVNASFISRDSTTGVALDGNGHLFVVGHNGILGEYTTDGATVNASLITGLGNTYGIAVVPIDPAPSIFAQPQSVTTNAHDNVSFSVTASGFIPLSYQWSLNGTNVSGANSSTLTVSNVAQSDLGTYAVVVTNGFGTVTSSNAVLAMYPFFAVPFGGAVTYWGKDAMFGVQGWGTGPLSYQWFKDGFAILDATNQTLTLTTIQFTNAGLYSVVLSSPFGSVTNTPAQVVVNPAGVSLGFSPTLTISGVVGYSYIIQSSANLADTNAWTTVTNLTLTQPVELWVDTSVDASSPSYSKYFYRVLPGQ